jgi:thioester reductase-like protein
MVDLNAEVVLEPDIQFHPMPQSKILNPKSILLTGATGFLGTFLLAELLRKTSAAIYCLIRNHNDSDCKERIKQHLQSYSLWDDALISRIKPIIGDFSCPFFGLSQQQFNELAGKIDVIYHNGAHVNYTRPYSVLKKSNVIGTREVLRLAGLTKTKPVHFISSMAVFIREGCFQDDIVRETDVPVSTGLKGGYEQSKWVAEQLILKARQRGLPACIYRSIRIMGHSKTGNTKNFDDLLCSMLRTCIALGKYPDIDVEVTMVPVDYVSRGIVYLSQQEKFFGKAFHFSHPHPIRWKQFIELIRSLGYQLEEISYEKWIEELDTLARLHPENKLYTRLGLSLRIPNYFFAKKPRFDSSITAEILKDASICCPAIDAELLSTYLSYFQAQGYLPAP